MTAFNSRLPSREESVLRYLVDRRAEERPDQVYIKTPDGAEITFRDMRDQVISTAAGLAALGVKQGDPVVVWMPNSPDMARVWYAINYLGAIYIPINIAYRGGLLEHVLNNAQARIIVADGRYVDRLGLVSTPSVETVVTFGDGSGAPQHLKVLPSSVLDGDADTLPALERPIEPSDVQMIIYTSGTTGPSKGVISTYGHQFHMCGSDGFPMITGEDRVLCNLPMFHIGGTVPMLSTLLHGGSVAIVEGFSTNNFWAEIDATQCTLAILLGVMSSFIMKQPPAPDDRDHCLKKVINIPLADDWKAVSERFGFAVWTVYNMTELCVPLSSERNPAVPGTCGRPRRGVELRLVDDQDGEVPVGEVGELIIRTEAPWALNSGYFRNPEATVEAWRNGWFHTGDFLRRDEHDNYFFVDRKKDAIRRRGENISSFEVEAEVLAHPLVRECAVVPVPSRFSEDEVLAVVSPVPGAVIDPVEFIDFLRPRLPYFMIPRYVRILSDLPRTPTQKVQKSVLRDEGVTADTWDREAAGIFIKRDS